VRTGNLDVTIPVQTADEIGQLADSLNHMVGELKQKEVVTQMFGRYVDPRVVQSLLVGQQQVAHGGGRQVASVFFSDIEGFTAMCEDLLPTAVVRLLNRYFTLMSEPIHAHQGIIDKYIGDSVMAFWGPPFTSPTDHATLACRAALEQQARVPKLQADLPELLERRRNLPTIRVRMGIATGEVTVGSIGSEVTRGYTVIGDTVNLGSRLEGANKQYDTQILICEETRRRAGDAIEAREIDAIQVVGKTEPVRVYELLGLKGDISRQTADLRSHYERGLTLYREARWDEALAAFEECLKVRPTDGPSLLCTRRIGMLATRAAPAAWDGVWKLTEK
jgi:adenylate cyclase